jgi:glucose-6-phosphate 1-dehydrogenase
VHRGRRSPRHVDDALRGSLMKGLHEFATRPVDDKIANRRLECVTYAEADPSDLPPLIG